MREVDLQHGPGGGWSATVFGRFELKGPLGGVELPTRKAEGVVAVLVLAGASGIDRKTLGAMLWSDSPRSRQLSSLRQALSSIKKVAGGTFLETQGQRCRISPSAQLTSDWSDASRRQSGEFMPLLDPDSLREIGRFKSLAVAQDASITPVSGLIEMLRFFSVRDPRQMLLLMRDCHSMISGIPAQELRRLLPFLTHQPDMPGWKEYFCASLLGDTGNIESCTGQVRAAVDLALKNGDRLLLGYALFNLLTFSILRNNLPEAKVAAARLAELSGSSRLMATSAKLGHALVHLHFGNEQVGQRLLSEAQEASPEMIEKMTIQGLRAFFLSTYNHPDEAEELLARPRSAASESGHSFLSLMCDFTAANLLVKREQDEHAIDSLTRVCKMSAEHASWHLNIYAEEAMSISLNRLGNAPKAGKVTASSRSRRKAIAMGYTPWDRMRILAGA